MECRACGFENLEGTRYCQGCGEEIRRKKTFMNSKNTKFIYGMGSKGSSLAPLAGMAIEKQTAELGEVLTHKTLVKVLPLEDKRWYCPDCGELNDRNMFICKGCGRDFI